MSNGEGRSTGGFGINRQQSVELIVKTALENGVNDPQQIAYMLATAQHETRNFTAPDEDYGRSQARKHGYRGGENYYGRGYVHLTHDENYEKFDKLLGLNGELVRNPELAKDPEIAAKILVVGMRDGLFTGKAIGQYIDQDSHDLYNARRTVNGVRPSQPWSVQAAKDTKGYAEAWEQRVPDLIEKVQRDGVDLSQRGSEPRTGPAGGAGASVPKQGAAVNELQTSLAALGYIGRDGKPLASDGHFGPNTVHAVKDFQRAHGLDDDGIVGPKTTKAMEHARTHPLISEKSHPSNALYRAVAEDLPAGTKPSVIANVTMQAMENGITDPSKLRDVVPLKNGDVMVRGNAIGTQVQVDLQAPTPGIQQMSDHVAKEAQERQQQMQQQQEQQQTIQQGQTRFA